MSSDDSSGTNNRGGPPAPQNSANSKSKKKKKLPPQETIDKIWSRFSASRFSKATKVLSFTKHTLIDPSKVPTTSPPPNNLLVSEDFERAVQECRAKVKKLIKECRRVNMRYRDPTFDIDWDLKWEKGYCLNGLAESKFEISGRAFVNPNSTVPKAVKRVHEIFDKPTFLKAKVSPADVKQGSLGDCWLMASLTALANMEVGIQRICVEYDTTIGIYGFVFHRDGEWIISIIDDKLYLKSPDWDSPSVQRHLLEQTDREDVEKEYRKTYQTGSQALFFAHCRDQNETWLPLLEKAYAKAHGDYAALLGGWIGEGVEDLTGGVTTELLTSDILDIDEFWNNEIMKVNKEFVFGCSTGLLDGGYGTREGISEGHAYVIMEARELSSGERLLKLRNPWGKGKKGNWEGAWSDGSKEFTPEAQQELNHKFGNDSVFWISYQDLLRKYQHFDRTRLFMDSPDWRLTQKWISMEVPWKAEFEQTFRIVLRKESPVILVLSQLDDRYFDGLQGQYSFRLQFRLHEVGSPGEEDYIVRSHGNYLMERSVVTELKRLKAGTYSVFIMVVADRDTSAASVEDVVKSQCQQKKDNDKLAQVGQAYDLAHSKGAQHMNSQVATRKAKEKAEARASRIAIRRKAWEKRHQQREIIRKQGKKNLDKRERKEAKDEAEEVEEEEKEPKDQGVQTDDFKGTTIQKEDKASQTEEPVPEPNVSATQPVVENNKAVQVSIEDFSGSTISSQGTASTPKSSSASSPPVMRVPAQAGPPPPSCFIPSQRRSSPPSQSRYSRRPPERGQQYIVSDGESSASPISEQDDYFKSDDEQASKSRQTVAGDASKQKKESDGDDDPEPWNAVCIVGFRVYSKDEGLEVKLYEEGKVEDELLVGELKNVSEACTDADDEEGDANKTNSSKTATVAQGHAEVERESHPMSEANYHEAVVPVQAQESDKVTVTDRKREAAASMDSTTTTNGDAPIIELPAIETKADTVEEARLSPDSTNTLTN
ncbi:Stomach-specific M-type calpain [Hyphodiscus hymeniophilus]|uniref:Stomach-specific M-type calpain n=1 Tax=Hyphodiscus hymeniophilus TaxID=353542 RepID=A0A9P6VGG9_9HELO|nr:Stomach-specific M-type calpain [Hyphodiscus hymeniophilus]